MGGLMSRKSKQPTSSKLELPNVQKTFKNLAMENVFDCFTCLDCFVFIYFARVFCVYLIHTSVSFVLLYTSILCFNLFTRDFRVFFISSECFVFI